MLPGSTDDTFLYNYAATGNWAFLAITDVNMITALRAAVTIIGSAELGYEAADVGTHSIRSGVAMALVLSLDTKLGASCYLDDGSPKLSSSTSENKYKTSVKESPNE